MKIHRARPTLRCLLSTAVIAACLWAPQAYAQFTGPGAAATTSTVEQAREARVNSYVTLTGNVVNHLREDYYTFRDQTGEIRVQIASEVWKNRQVGPTTQVRLRAEVDLGLTGRYLWVESLEVLP